MRGISFTASARPDKPSAPNPRSTTSFNPPPSASKKMMKKLSITFRRKTNVSPTTILSAADVLHSAPQPAEAPADAPARPDPHRAPKARAMTFSAGSRVDLEPESALSDPDIPFFGDRDRDSEAAAAPAAARAPASQTVAVVRGKPAWLRDSDDPAAPAASQPASHPRQLSHHPRPAAPVLKESNRARHHSFDVPRTAAKPDPPARRPPSGRRRRPSRRRWLLPLPESKDEPRLFVPPAGTPFERIGRHRDRAEAKVLVSACTYLEAEVERMTAQLDKPCCSTKPDASKCPHRAFVAASAERMRCVLGILEDRYDSIEQVYVKSEEYARAMGKFFQLSPDEFSRMVSQRELNSKHSQKSLR